jgi:inward rectifier potassium channel
MGDTPAGMAHAEACFWFSSNNLITIGYGNLVPASRVAAALTSLEHFVGILLSSILLGLVVAKASLPSAKLVFSKAMLVTPRNGVPKLIARVCNTRGNYLLNPEARPSYRGGSPGQWLVLGERC